jgi:hypothetical protein
MPKTGQPLFDRVSPDQLLFDGDNPRFGGGLGTKSQPDIQKAIYGAPHYASELVDSLLENGFIDYEPLVVKRQGDKYVVIEGNRRLAAIKEIRANFDRYKKRRSNLDSVPVIVFPDQVKDGQGNEARVYLGLRHLLGFREWLPAAKAEFLDNESRKPGGLEQILKEVRLTKQKARRFLIPYRLLNDAKFKLPDGEDFWVMAEALQRAGVKKFLQLDVDSSTLEVRGYNKANLKLLLDDLYGPRDAALKIRNVAAKKVHDTRDLSTYGLVLSSEKATAVLHGGKGLSEAAIYVDSREQSQTRLARITKELGVLISKLMRQDKSGEAVTVNRAFKELESSIKAYLKEHAKPNI